MKPKNPNRIKQTLIYLVWGLIAMVLVFIFMIAMALIGWGP
jgi:hypothetical protein